MSSASRTGLFVVASLLLLCVYTVTFGQGAPAKTAPAGLEPWASKTRPDDVAKNFSQLVATSGQKYNVTQGGTVDGLMCRGPMGVGMSGEGALEQSWESNRQVRMENVGDTDVVNPWLTNGRYNFRTVEDIVASAILPGMNDAEKTQAIWFQESSHRYHWAGDNPEMSNPVKVFNVYGHNTCGNDSGCLAAEFKVLGLKSAAARAIGHCIPQVFYNGGYHFLDGDQHAIYLLRDNVTVACDIDFARDHDLVKRTHTSGILLPDRPSGEERDAAMYWFEGPITIARNGAASTMDMTLRPGEALVWRWGHLIPEKSHRAGPKTSKYPDTICNGLWEYRPDFTKDIWKKGAAVQNVSATPTGLAADQGNPGTIVWKVASPYVFLGGRLEVEGAGAKFALSRDGKSWTDVAGTDFDSFFPVDKNATYAYQLRCTLEGDARLKKIAIVNDVQMAPLSLPEMTLGQNTFTYTDASQGERKVKITHEWVERTSMKPPTAPASPVSPADSGDISGTDVVFKWAPVEGAADYQFALSLRADMHYPLSMSFYKLVSRTGDKGNAQYTLLTPGLLTPDTKYYWHVRAKTSAGVWGPWSKTWSFTPKGPAYPTDITLKYDEATGVGTLSWKANTVGNKPVKYRVYGSEEKGFTVSDKPYTVLVGQNKDLANPFPANFIAESPETSMVVLGPAAPANANKTFYRVVAVDAQDKRSGSSDYAAAPRPVIFTKPVVAAKVGAAYEYKMAANRSIGDLNMRGAGETVSFYDVETPKFELTQGPAWLKVDAATGVLSGTPDAAGKADVVVTATIDRNVRKLDEGKLIWGQDVTTEKMTRIGASTQKFTIDVK